MIPSARGILVAFVFAGVCAFASGSTLTLAPDTIIGGAASMATLTLDTPAGASGLTASISSNNPAVKVPASVSVPGGLTSATFPVTTLRVDTQVQVTISASVNGAAINGVLTINPVSLAALSVSATSIVGGLSCTGTIMLTAAAGSSGVSVTVASASGDVVVPATVKVPAGLSSVAFPIQTRRLSKKEDTVLTASLGLVTTTATMSVWPEGPLSLSLNPAAVNGGDSAVGTVVLTGPAPAGGLTLTLKANNKSLTIPATVKVDGAATSATFNIKTIKVSTLESVLIAAKYRDQTQTATLAVAPPGISTIVLNPASVTGFVPSGGTITLAEPAPPGGLKIALSSDQPSATVPAQIIIPAGKKTASFTVRTVGVAAPVTANIKAVTGNVPKQAPLLIAPPALLSLVLGSPVVDGGTGSSGTVTIGSPAPPAGLVVVLACAVKGVVVPVSVSIEAYHTSASFRIRTAKVTAQTQAAITATFLSTTQTATLTIN